MLCSPLRLQSIGVGLYRGLSACRARGSSLRLVLAGPSGGMPHRQVGRSGHAAPSGGGPTGAIALPTPEGLDPSSARAGLRALENKKRYKYEPIVSRDAGGLALAAVEAAAKQKAKARKRRHYGPLQLNSGERTMEHELGASPGPSPRQNVDKDDRAGGESQAATSASGPADDHSMANGSFQFYQPKLLAMASNPEVLTEKDKIYKSPFRPRLGDNGYKNLKEAVYNSHNRRKLVMSGTTLKEAMDQRKQGSKGKNPKPPKSAKGATTLPAIPGLVPNPITVKKSAAELFQLEAGLEELLNTFFNPAATVKEIAQGFEESRVLAMRRLDKALQRLPPIEQEETRVISSECKLHTLNASLETTSIGKFDFNAEKWRLLSEKKRLESSLQAFQDHEWFIGLIEAVTENGRTMTHPEEHVIGEIKKVIEMGEAFDVFDFLTMVACVPKSYHESDGVQRIFEYLRRAVDVRPSEFRDFLEQRGISNAR